MGQIVIQDVDDGLIEQLRRYATLHKYSLEEMLREILVNTVSQQFTEVQQDIDTIHSGKKRVPPYQFKGKVREFGDLLSSVPQTDWTLPE